MAYTTLANVIQGNNTYVFGLVENAVTETPEFNVLPVKVLGGTTYKLFTRTSLPSSGFRAVNAGIGNTGSVFSNDTVTMKVVSSPIACDIAAARAYEAGEEAYKAIEAGGAVASTLITWGKQIFNGTDATDGFTGLNSLNTASAFSATVIKASATSSAVDSVYAVKAGELDFTLVAGNNSAIQMRDWSIQQVNDSNGKAFDAYTSGINAWVGLQFGSIYSVGRIANLNTANPLTDSLLAQLLSKFPVGKKPSHIFMNRTSAYQLQQARSVVTLGTLGGVSSGATTVTAPWPVEYQGIPIIVTDSIVNGTGIA